LAEQLQLTSDDYVVTFQSRFGRERWLEPYTEPTLIALAQSGVQSVNVICPGFSSDCLETLEEIDQECKAAFLAHGGQSFGYIPCLNDTPEWTQALTRLVQQHLQGWRVASSQDRQMAQQRAIQAGAKQ
jgi:ferrochelatase